MYRLALLILFVSALSAVAREPDYRSYFNYPNVQITMDYGADVGHAQTIPFKNYLFLTIAEKTPIFQGGWKMSGNRPDNPRVQWRFINKTESGDLYLISIYQKERLTKEVPVLYTGSSLVAYNQNRINITFEPPENAKWKAL